MKIIDIHAHIWDVAAGWANGQPRKSATVGKMKIGNRLVQALPPAFEASASHYEVLIAYMDWCGISKTILMPNPLYGFHNDYFIEAINAHPDRFRGVALVDLAGGKSSADELQEIYDKTPLFGMKIESESTFMCHPGMRIADDACRPVFDCMNQNHQPMFVHPFSWEDLEDLDRYADEFPDITFVICHMGADSAFSAKARPEGFPYVLEMVKKHSNMYIDTSTVPYYYTDDEYPFAVSTAYIEQGYKVLGAEKIMWASDYPGMLNYATMKELINMVMLHCPSISEKDMELIMAGNAERLFFS